MALSPQFAVGRDDRGIAVRLERNHRRVALVNGRHQIGGHHADACLRGQAEVAEDEFHATGLGAVLGRGPGQLHLVQFRPFLVAGSRHIGRHIV
jgi:hypothetical protein